MKKGLKLAFTAAIAMSALTPAAVFAIDTPATGFYTADSFTSPLQYKNLTLSEKQKLLAREDLTFVVNNLVYFAKEAIGKSDAELSKIAITVAEFQGEYGELTNSGYGEIATDFAVESIE